MRLRPAVAALCLGALVAAPTAVALTTGPGTTSAAFAPALVLNNAQGVTTGGAEPSIEVDSFDNVYVSAPAGVPTGGCPFWEVEPDAGTYAYRGTVDTDHLSVGGGDCDISVTDNPAPGATHDVASITSLSLANLTSNKTADGGATFQTVANPASQQVFGVDRQWQASDRGLDRHYLTVHDLGTANIQTSVSTDGGYQYVQNTPVIDPTVTPQALSSGVSVRGVTGSNSFGTTVVDPVTHKLYVPFIAPQGQTFEHNTVYVAEGDPCATLPCEKGSPAGPITWTTHQVFQGALTDELGLGFPAIAIDQGGTVWVGWTGDAAKPATAGSGQDTDRVFVTHSQPRDVSSWAAPVAVDAGTGHANVFPWLVAGAPGSAGIAWYSSVLGSACVGETGPTTDVNDDCHNVWDVSYAATADTGSTWEVSTVSAAPVHRGAICTGGLSCPAGTRTLLDFFDVALDSSGRPNFAYNADTRAPGTADLHYTRQCAGTSLTGVVLGGCAAPPTGGGDTGTACPGDGAGFVDEPGDATEVLVTGETSLPNDPSLDLLDGTVAWSAGDSSAVLRMRVADLGATPTAGDQYFRWQVKLAGDPTAYSLSATRPADGSAAPSYLLFSTGATDVTSQPLTGSFDEATGVVEIRLASSAYQAARAANTPLSADRGIVVTSALGQRVLRNATPTADTAAVVCSAALAQPVAATPAPTATATVSPTPTATPTTTPTPTATATPTPTCTPKGNGNGKGACKK